MSANFDSVLLRENSTVAIAIFRIVGFEAAARGLDENFIYTWEIDLGHFHTNPYDPKPHFLKPLSRVI